MTLIVWTNDKGQVEELYYSPHGYSLTPWRKWLSEEEAYVYNKLNRKAWQPYQMDKMDVEAWRKQMWSNGDGNI